MLYDDISFKVAYLKLLSGICQGNMGVLPSMQGLTRISSLALPPVVEEEVMQQPSPGSRAVVEA